MCDRDASPQPPLLFLDVDGPLIPFGAPPEQYQTYWTAHELKGASSNPLLPRLNPDHGARLAALDCELVWATTWMAEANDCLAPLLGLPPLRIVLWPEPSELEVQDERDDLHWKTRALVDWADGRPFAWVDDEITATDRTWVSANYPADALLHRVDPRVGLTDADYELLAEWLRKIQQTPLSHGTA